MDTAAERVGCKERLEDVLIVDCDVHVHESPGELAPYCEMPWRKALENIKDVQEYYLDIPGFSPGMTWYEARFPSGHEGRRMVHAAQQMRKELDEIHVNLEAPPIGSASACKQARDAGSSRECLKLPDVKERISRACTPTIHHRAHLATVRSLAA